MGRLNDISFHTATSPRLSAKVGGDYSLRSVIDCEVTNNNFYEADTFRVVSTLSREQPPWNLPSTWGNRFDLSVDIDIGNAPFGSGQGTELLAGLVDDVSVDPIRDEVILTGRDYTSVFIDGRITGANVQALNVANQLASSVVSMIASYFTQFITKTVIVPTTVRIGATDPYGNQWNFRNRSWWDVITWLAQTNVNTAGNPDPYVAYVKGKTLYFIPQSMPTDWFEIEWQPGTPPTSNAKSLELTHNLTLAKDIAVTVHGFSLGYGKYSATATGKHQGSTGGGSFSQGVYDSVGYQHYVYAINGISPAQAQQIAQARCKMLSQHELILRAGLPGDPTLDPYGLVKLSGMGSPWDGGYWINAVTWRYAKPPVGLTMELWCKNHPVAQQVVL